MCLIPILEGVIYDGIISSKTPFKGLAPINKVKEVLIHIRFNIVHRNMANSTDPDEMSQYASSGSTPFVNAPYLDGYFLINALRVLLDHYNCVHCILDKLRPWFNPCMPTCSRIPALINLMNPIGISGLLCRN